MSTIGHLWIPVSNLDRSVEFYTAKLGLKKKALVRKGEAGVDPGLRNSFAQLSDAEGSIMIMLLEAPEVLPSRGSVTAGFVVDDLARAKVAFEKAGVEFIGDRVEFGDRVIEHFLDPDGHVFQLVAIND